MLETIAEAMGDLCNSLVFVGGSVTGLYVDRPGAPEPRPTMDVDCITGIMSRLKFQELENAMRQRGFRNDQSPGAPLCRWTYGPILLDLMPADSSILGFTNEWYSSGLSHTEDRHLASGRKIRILTLPFFIASKLTALKGRGLRDLRTSRDFEDIVYVFNNRRSVVDEILNADNEVRRYLVDSFKELAAMDSLLEAITAAMDFGEPRDTPRRINETIGRIIALGNTRPPG